MSAEDNVLIEQIWSLKRDWEILTPAVLHVLGEGQVWGGDFEMREVVCNALLGYLLDDESIYLNISDSWRDGRLPRISLGHNWKVIKRGAIDQVQYNYGPQDRRVSRLPNEQVTIFTNDFAGSKAPPQRRGSYATFDY